MTHPGPTFDARSALSALRESEARTQRATDPNPPRMYVLWGSVYTLGYVTLHAALYGWATLSLSSALLVFAALTLVGAAVSAVLGVRSGKDLRGESSRRGLFYGLSWASGMVTAGFIVVALLRLDLPSATVVWLTSAVVMLLIGVLFAAGGAVSLERPTFLLGLGLLGANILAVLIGPGPFVLIGWLAACATLFAGAVVEARRRAPASAA